MLFTTHFGKEGHGLHILARLFAAFCRIGLFTFGGGYAMLPLMQRELAEKNRWVNDEELADYYAMSQCLPGAIAVNLAVFVGHKCRGRAGAAVAVCGLALPSLLLMIMIAAFLQNFTHLPVMQHAFAGVRVAVGVLIVNAVVRFWKSGVPDKLSLFICAAAFSLLVFFRLSPVYVVVIAAAAGLVIALRPLGKRGERR